MGTLTELTATHGFTAGDIDTDGWFAMIPAYQKIYFADGRADGYHKLDMINTILTGDSSGSFTQGEILEQATSGAKGVFDETAGSGASAQHFVYRITSTQFDTTNTVTGADSGETVTPTAVQNPPYWLDWTPTAGSLPGSGANAGCLCFGRVFLNSIANPNQWFASRVGDPLDFQVSQNDIGTAVSSQTSKAGVVSSELVGFIPFSPHYLIFSCIDSLWVLRGDPVAGGVLNEISDGVGMVSPTSYCWDDNYNLYILGFDGIYFLTADGIVRNSPAVNITRNKLPRLFKDMAVSRLTDHISMAYDRDRYGIMISVTQADGAWSTSFWVDLRTGDIVEEGVALFPEVYTKNHRAHSLFYYPSPDRDERALLVGCDDGYIRKFDDDTNNDDGTAIDSYFTVGPFVGQNVRGQILHKETSIQLGTDSDGVSVGFYSGKTAQEVVESIEDGDAARAIRTLTSANLNRSIQNRIRNGSIAFTIGNENSGESFQIERIISRIEESGRLK